MRIEISESHPNPRRHGDHGWISCLESKAGDSIYKAKSMQSIYYLKLDVSVLYFQNAKIAAWSSG